MLHPYEVLLFNDNVNVKGLGSSFLYSLCINFETLCYTEKKIALLHCVLNKWEESE